MIAKEPQPTGPETDAPAQFGLGGMLWFVVACSAYCSQLAACPQLFTQWRSVLAIFVAWLILGAFLLTKGVRGMIVAHCAAPVLVLAVCLLGVLITPHLVLADFGAFLRALAVVCLVSSLVSFPASVVRLVLVAIWGRFQGTGKSPASTRVTDAPAPHDSP
jgi:uncharacterized membrane protein